ncbi:polyprenyl synthetase family protein [Flavobacterium sp. ENC]|uniref:polyprenyl synthetase family protein n=1 Tax=Flavobacterium sp. ENC TaxID=2897330 RepID=UPI001E3F849D|nr:polyprenyl synthetase family protein [Flavobacterium sp. ENC]MCD0465253.1 polyprenyl synthetase family protein [Flavobacterium sp. ENC]
MYSLTQYTEFFTCYLKAELIHKEPKNLFEPISYMLSLGGKRTRPVLTLIASEIFDCNYQSALPAAVAVEVFHNSTLIHDDIIDDDPIRRGKPTVHQKWNTNAAILSGDAMIILTYQYLEQYQPSIAIALIKVINKMALEICEGQTLDVDFESRHDVTVAEYLKMIQYKTAVLIASSLKMGAVIAKASEKNCELIYDFGLNIGMAFQLQDDYLDIFGDTPTFGRRIGGDIIANKKTFLYLKSLELSAPAQKTQLQSLYDLRLVDNTEKIKKVTQLFVMSGVEKATQEAVAGYTLKAFDILNKLKIRENKKALLKEIGTNLMIRKV